MRSKSRSKGLSKADLERIKSVSSITNGHTKTSFDDALNVLITRCVHRGYAKATIQYYRNELRVFRYYLADCHPEAIEDISVISSLDIPKFCRYMSEVRHAQVGNINTKLKAIKTFFKTNDMSHIADHCSPLVADKNVIPVFSSEQVRQLLDTCDLTSYIGVRDYVMMLVFADTGIRVKELIGLRVKDFHPSNGALHIRHSKNKYDRYAPISEEVSTMVEALISLNVRKDPNAYVFQSIHGEALSRRSINNRITKAGERAGIRDQARCSPHTFRHYFAKTTIENGANVFQLQKMLGHSSLEMVRRYVNLFDREVFDAHKRYSPKHNFIK